MMADDVKQNLREIKELAEIINLQMIMVRLHLAPEVIMPEDLEIVQRSEKLNLELLAKLQKDTPEGAAWDYYQKLSDRAQELGVAFTIPTAILMNDDLSRYIQTDGLEHHGRTKDEPGKELTP